MSNTTSVETVTVYGLMAFSEDPAVHGSDVDAMLSHCDGAVYSLRPEWLPHGGWGIQGAAHEVVVERSVPVGSFAARSALNNDQVEGHTL